MNSLCNVEDFEHPEVRSLLRELYPEDRGVPQRSRWETAMALLGLVHGGALHTDAEILTIGRLPGRAASWLGERVRSVEHIEGTAMVELPYGDGRFDGVIAPGSISVLGAMAQVARTMDEASRVLRSGGTMSLTADYCVAPGDPAALRVLIAFERDEIDNVLVGDRPWRLTSPLRETLSAATIAQLRELGTLPIDELGVATGREQSAADAAPEVLVRVAGRVISSLHIALRRGG